MSVNVLITVDNCYQERCHLWHSSQVDMKVFAVVKSDLRGSDDGTNHYIQYVPTHGILYGHTNQRDYRRQHDRWRWRGGIESNLTKSMRGADKPDWVVCTSTAALNNKRLDARTASLVSNYYTIGTFGHDRGRANQPEILYPAIPISLERYTVIQRWRTDN